MGPATTCLHLCSHLHAKTEPRRQPHNDSHAALKLVTSWLTNASTIILSLIFSLFHIKLCWVILAISQADMTYCTCSWSSARPRTSIGHLGLGIMICYFISHSSEAWRYPNLVLPFCSIVLPFVYYNDQGWFYFLTTWKNIHNYTPINTFEK